MNTPLPSSLPILGTSFFRSEENGKTVPDWDLSPPRDAAVATLAATGRKPRRRFAPGQASGLTLVEIMIAFGIFSILALACVTSLLQTRRMSEDNVAQATAAVIAQGIIEQVQLNGYEAIADTVSSPNLELKFTGTNTNNLASIQQYDLPWATDTTTFTPIGARVNPADSTSAILGVLLDLEYRAGSTVIRPARYMKMRVNIQRTVHPGDNNVEIILMYQWQPPSRNALPTDNVYLTREIRTIRSEAPSY